MCVANPLGRGNALKQRVQWCIFAFFGGAAGGRVLDMGVVVKAELPLVP